MLNIFSRPWGSADELIIYCIFESDKKKNIFCVKLHQDLKKKNIRTKNIVFNFNYVYCHALFRSCIYIC